MKEIEFIPSDESIKELYDLHIKLNLFYEEMSYDEFYKKHKKPSKVLFG